MRLHQQARGDEVRALQSTDAETEGQEEVATARRRLRQGSTHRPTTVVNGRVSGESRAFNPDGTGFNSLPGLILNERG